MTRHLTLFISWSACEAEEKGDLTTTNRDSRQITFVSKEKEERNSSITHEIRQLVLFHARPYRQKRIETPFYPESECKRVEHNRKLKGLRYYMTKMENSFHSKKRWKSANDKSRARKLSITFHVYSLRRQFNDWEVGKRRRNYHKKSFLKKTELPHIWSLIYKSLNLVILLKYFKETNYKC